MSNRGQAVAIAACLVVVGCTGNLESSADATLSDDTGTTPVTDLGVDSYHEGDDAGGPGDECLPLHDYFNQKVWPTVIRPTCANCHAPPGPGTESRFVLSGQEDPTDQDFEIFRSLALEPILLEKPLGGADHGGEEVLDADGHAYSVLETFVERVNNPGASCNPNLGEDDSVDVVLMSPKELYRRVALSIGGRRMTDAEAARLDAEGEQALEPMLDDLLREDGFYQRLRDSYNDILLTDAPLVDRDNHPGGYLDEEHYPDRMWFGSLPVDQRRETGQGTRYGLSRAPLELIIHVVREGKPFSEVLTADYVMMNSYAARSYGVYDAAAFDDPDDPNEYRPFELPPDPLTGDAFPTAGILSNYFYLSRYPSTATNRNRHRARMIFDHFLNTDVMDLTPTRADPTEVAEIENPVMNAPQCTVCHSVIDPVAGTLQNYDILGRRNPTLEEGWYDDVFPPGFEGEALPADKRRRALPWLAQKIVDDPRFADAAAAHAYQLLFAREPLGEPMDPTASDFDARVAAYQRQQTLLEEAAQVFVDSGLDFRVLVRHLILSDDYRAAGLENPPASETATHIAQSLGATQLATPEQLTRRLTAVLGEPWIFRYSEPFLSSNRFRLLYGGIDSAAMIERIREPNALMGAIVQLMANDVGCRFVGSEMGLAPEDRILLSEVLITDVPSGDDASPTESDVRIRAAVAGLHARFLGEYEPEATEEIEATVELFNDLQRAGKAGIDAGEVPVALDHHCGKNTGSLRDDPDYTVRAWAGVVSYLLQTYDFLYE